MGGPRTDYMDLYDQYRTKMQMLTHKQIQEEVEMMKTLQLIQKTQRGGAYTRLGLGSRAALKTHCIVVAGRSRQSRAASTLPPISHRQPSEPLSARSRSSARMLPPPLYALDSLQEQRPDLYSRSTGRASQTLPAPQYLPFATRKELGAAIRPPTEKFIPGAQLPGVQRGAGEAGVLCVRDTTLINFCPIPTLEDHRKSMNRRAYSARNSMYMRKVPAYCPAYVPSGPFANLPRPSQRDAMPNHAV